MGKKFSKFSVVSILVLAVAAFIYSGAALAFSNSYPDPADTSGSATIRLVSGETQYVRKMNTRVRVWFANSSGGTITISNANFCNSNQGDIIETEDSVDWSDLGNGDAVTHFDLYRNDPGNRDARRDGNKYNSGNPNCNQDRTFNVSNLTRTQNNYYYVDIDINHIDKSAGFDGIMNFYRITATGPNTKIGLPGDFTGFGATMEQVGSTPQYVDYNAVFGTPCNNNGENDVRIVLYDLDNAGGSGAQPAGQDIVVRLYDKTDNQYIDFNGPNVDTRWRPNGDNQESDVRFNSQANHKYRLEINHVFYNNTIQYSVPYSQIFDEPCKSAALVPRATVSQGNVPVNTPVTFENWVETRNLQFTGNDEFSWRVNGSVPAAGLVGVTQNQFGDTPRDVPAGRNAWTFTPTVEGTYCRRTVITNASYANLPQGDNAEACVVVGSGGSSANINTFIDTPIQYEKGTGAGPYSITSRILCGGNYSGTVNWRVTDNTGVVVNKTIVYTNCNPNNASNEFTTLPSPAVTAAQLDSSSVGVYRSYTVEVISPSGVSSKSSSITVRSVPYARFYGHDIYAGCNVGQGSDEGFILFNVNPNGNLAGAAVEYAAIAITDISSQIPVGTNPITTAFNKLAPPARPNGLRAYFPDGFAPCPPDFINANSDLLPTDSRTLLSENLNISTEGSDAFLTRDTDENENLTLTGTTNHKLTIMAHDIYLSGSGTFGANLPDPNSPFNDASSSVVLIIATGNVYIDPNLTTVNAIIIASQGTVYTCGSNTYAKIPQEEWHNRCMNKLVINGAVGANGIEFGRSIGTRKLGVGPSEPANQPQGNNSAAEVINFPYYLYFASPYLDSSIGEGYDSIINAAPYL